MYSSFIYFHYLSKAPKKYSCFNASKIILSSGGSMYWKLENIQYQKQVNNLQEYKRCNNYKRI